MGTGLRQSMAWLHRWVGLLFGWLLFFIFLTGTLGFLDSEIDRWMRPELPAPTAWPPATRLVTLAEARLRDKAPTAESWFIRLPGDRETPALMASWRTRPDQNGKQAFKDEALSSGTGEPITDAIRETGGGQTLYAMHYALHYMPREAGLAITGAAAMAMLVALLSGTVIHRKIFADFFTFRPGKGQRSWLDGHTLLAVTSLPFHLMITWSGLIMYLFLYMPLPLATLYPDPTARDRAVAEGSRLAPEEPVAVNAAPAPLVPLAPLVARAEARWGAGSIGFIRVEDPGRADARIALHKRTTDYAEDVPALRFEGASGRPILALEQPTAPGRFRTAILNLHEGIFAGPILRFLYIGAGLAGTAMIGTGLILWTEKRRARRASAAPPDRGLALVDTLNLGTIVGLPVGIAAYFWANRLLPAGMEGRAAWEVHILFLAWGLAYILAIWRQRARAWRELCWFAAAAWGLLPALNAINTDRHLGHSLAVGDWALAALDLGMLAVGLFFAFLARQAAVKSRAVSAEPVEALA
ncbi:putative iron-regulated membrane protein [Sphingobium sp. OAS761]|uniref:PepSY-associated TM helix domain-containing protein n=1 Tax=Sphingobium sp. OAS761 TaxID=2817901 RepID=UPI0020A14315|nr:PepSY-associated TM helix domain-containing protein [Sphingobium sp. OAS761]MCP1469672.1 putative iron-regulated membrane protein [Sphingobium sp. OAS761]